jgi:Desulfoferrodoxin, N-terminal domain
MPTEYPNGTRLRCARCGSEVIVLKSNEPVLECCGEPMKTTFVPARREPETR